MFGNLFNTKQEKKPKRKVTTRASKARAHGRLRKTPRKQISPTEERSITAEDFPSIFSLQTKAGVIVTQESSMQFSTVFACVDLIASTLSIIPVNIMEEKDGGKYPATSHDQYYLLKKEPHNMYSRSQWIKMMAVHYLLWGNGVSIIRRDQFGRPVEYEIQNPWDVRIDILKDKDTGQVSRWYQICGETYRSSDIIDFSDISLNGKKGLGRVSPHQETIGLGLALRDYGNELIGNGGKMMGYVYGEKKMNRDAYKILAERFLNGYGADNSVGVLPYGWKYEPFKYPLPPASAEYIAGKNFSTEEVCTIFRTHPFLIGLSKGVNNSVAESLIRTWLMTTIAPITTMMELELDRKIFRDSEKNTHFVKYNLWSLDKADMEKTTNALVQQLYAGLINKDEARDKLDLNPIVDGLGKDHYQPLNQAPLDVAKEHFLKENTKAND